MSSVLLRVRYTGSLFYTFGLLRSYFYKVILIVYSPL